MLLRFRYKALRCFAIDFRLPLFFFFAAAFAMLIATPFDGDAAFAC